MPLSRHIAILGVTPFSLLLGRACCLADCPPVGLYDPDPANALRGALFLGISARQQAAQLSPAETPLQVAFVGHEQAAHGLDQLPPDRAEGLLVISLCPLPAPGRNVCFALPLTPSESELAGQAIASFVPDIVFRLEGETDARLAAQELLRSLSPNIRFAP